MEQSSIGEEKLIRAVAGASDVGVDITESARVRANGQVVLIRELIASFDSPHVILAFEIQRDPFKRPYLEMSSGTFGFGYDIDDIILLENVVFTGGSGRTNTRYDIIDHEFGTQKREYTAFSIICKQLRQAGYSISFEGPHEFHIGNYCGPEGGTGRLKDPDIKPGMRVTRWCLCLTATQSV